MGEFARTGGHGKKVVFPGPSQPEIERPEGWILHGGNHCRHPQTSSEIGVAALLECTHIAKNLLVFARKDEICKEKTDINGLLVTVLDNHACSIADRTIQHVPELDPDLPPVQVDSYQIERVFDNIAKKRARGNGRD